MTRPKLNLQPESVLRAVLAGGFLLMLAANLPGHLSYDSVVALQEGRFGERLTWAPAFYSWVLGAFDAVVPGTGLYVVGSSLILFASLASLAGLRGRVSWLAAPVALFIVLTPALLIYQAIVWKDVFFANVSVAALVCLAHAAKGWDARLQRWSWLAAALLLLAAGALTRQNGLVVGLLAAVALGWTAARGSVRRGLVWGVAGFVAVLIAVQVLGYVATPSRTPPGDGFDRGVRILRNYDIAGAVALDPSVRLDAMEAASPESARLLRLHAPKLYSAERVDYLARSPELTKALWSIPDEAVTQTWVDIITERPDLYLRQRLGVFRWVFLTPTIDRCLPVFVGVEAPADKLESLKLTGQQDLADAELVNYASWFLDTPVYSHLTYAVIAFAVAGVLLLRREAADVPMAALMLAALGFTASFFVISLACDYRYLYFLDVAAMSGLLYVAIDPPFGRKRRARR
jgi:hypothetical protein